MCDGILITFPNGHKLCVPIYREIIRWPPPGPDPWHRTIADISTIATISQAVANVRNEGVRGQLAHAVQTAFKATAEHLPGGVTIGDELMKVAADH